MRDYTYKFTLRKLTSLAPDAARIVGLGNDKDTTTVESALRKFNDELRFQLEETFGTEASVKLTDSPDMMTIVTLEGVKISAADFKQVLVDSLENYAELQFDEDGREENPRSDSMRERCNELYPAPRHHKVEKAGYSLGTLAVGAALGAGVYHLIKRKP